MLSEKTQVAPEAEGTQSGSGVSKKIQDLIHGIEGLTLLEAAGLVKALEEKFGVTAAAPAAAHGGASAGAGAAGGLEAVEEKTTFTVVLAKAGENKIQVIKEIRTITNLGLKEAKELVESAPKPVKEGVTKAEAEKIKEKLAAVGAVVELK